MNSITILGSFVVDLITRSESLPKQGQTLIAHSFDIGPGGKGQNQAVQSHLMDINSNFICKLGIDELSNVGKTFWHSISLPTHIFESATEKTGCANICVDDNGQNQISVYLGANNSFTENEIVLALDNIEESNILLIQAEINELATEKAIDIAYKKNVKIIYNPAPFRPMAANYLNKIFLITPNESEAAAMIEWDKITTENCIEAGRKIISMGPKNCIITLGEYGCVLVTENISKIFPTIKVNAIDTVGAGDSFNGALSAMVANGKSLDVAIKYALAASALSVTSKGSATSMKNINDIIVFAKQNNFNLN